GGVMARVPGKTANARTAPYHSCIGCYRGDTTTKLMFVGQPEFVAAGLTKIGIEEPVAVALVQSCAHDEYGCQRGMVPDGDMEIAVRLCRDCPHTAGLEVRDGDEIMAYRQPEAMRPLT